MSWMDGVTLHVQFYGKHPKEWDTINVYSQTTSEIPPLSTVKYVVDQNLKKGRKRCFPQAATGAMRRALGAIL